VAMAPYGDGSNVVLFGGLNLGPDGVFNEFNVLGDTWIWSGTDWTQVTRFLSLTPPARYGASMAYDPDSGTAVLFGGRDAAGHYLADTWSFKTTTVCLLGNCTLLGSWLKVNSPPGSGPSARSGAMMAKIPFPDYIFVTGGFDGSTFLNDTWQFFNSEWVQAPAFLVISPGRSDAAVAPCLGSPYTNDILVFGGLDSSDAAPLGDTWTFGAVEEIGYTWLGPGVPNPSPAPRFGPAMAYYPVSKFQVLYGGQGAQPLSGTPMLTDTYNGNCGTWSHVAPAHTPGPRMFHGMATGPGGFTVVLFGGDDLPFPRPANPLQFPNGRDHNDTWTWGRRVACLPVDGSQISEASRVKCQFDRADGIRFGGWSANGFDPEFRRRVDATFEADEPGPASITAEWADATGSHSQTFNYTIVRKPENN